MSKSMGIVFYWANLINYVRIMLTFVVIYCFRTSPLLAMSLHFLASLLDFIDGPIARHFNECSAFGINLDAVADRVNNFGFVIVLCHLYPDQQIWISGQFMASFISCWLYSVALGGKTSYLRSSQDPFIQWYGSEPVLSIITAGHEFFWLAWWVRIYYVPVLCNCVIAVTAVSQLFRFTAYYKRTKEMIKLFQSIEDSEK